MLCQKVDDWLKEPHEDCYFYSRDNNIILNLNKCLPKSELRILDKNPEIKKSLETFLISRKLFINAQETVYGYMNYFTEFFDDDKDLPTLYLYMKDQIDSNEISMTTSEFIKTLNGKFFRETNIKRNIYRMVDYCYDMDITVDSKTGREFRGPNDFTNEEAKRLLAISCYMKFVIPVTSHYIVTNTLYTDDELKGLMVRVFDECVFRMGSITGDEDEVDELLLKLYRFTAEKVEKHSIMNHPLWVQQMGLRGLTEHTHTDTIIQKHLIGNNMFKLTIDKNIMSFLMSVVETQLSCTINKVKYKATPSMIDATREFNGMSDVDKMEQNMAKTDESQIIRCSSSLADIMYRLKKEYGEISKDEIKFYMDNFNHASTFHDMLIKNFFASIFDGFIELKSAVGIDQYIELLIIAKRICRRQNTKQFHHLLSSVVFGRTSNRVQQSSRYLNKLDNDSTYKKLKYEKYKSLLGMTGSEENKILKTISFVLNNRFSYVEYDAPELLGQEIEFDEDIISNEILDFIDRI